MKTRTKSIVTGIGAAIIILGELGRSQTFIVAGLAFIVSALVVSICEDGW